ncbi:unnamed protein product [Wuchereria bancrofti]|uniref:RLR CTR domain-containing protein n=1 Tax=Wuchereria bancrofti TaxID=6293 RepID=A0A3P7DWC4_WUCBA|nr:unnamed protein product [Wuchereria bancrofti]
MCVLIFRKCDAIICNSSDIVVTPTYSQYICVCKEIWNRSSQRALSKTTIERETYYVFKGVGVICCVKCQHQWGRVVHYNNFTLPIIAATAFVLVAENGERFQRKRWKQIVESLFRPRNIELYDYANMKTAKPDLSDLIIDNSCI